MQVIFTRLFLKQISNISDKKVAAELERVILEVNAIKDHRDIVI